MGSGPAPVIMGIKNSIYEYYNEIYRIISWVIKRGDNENSIFLLRRYKLIIKSHLHLFVPVIILALILAACAPPATAHVYYVSTSGNDSNDCLSTVHACLTVAAAVTKATPRSQINIGAGNFTVQQTVNKWLDFIGAGQTQTALSASDSTRWVFLIQDGVHASFSNLTINGGSNGIQVDGVNIATQVTGTNITVMNAQCGINSIRGSAVVINNSLIMSNDVGIISFRGKLNVTNTTLRVNHEALVNSSDTVLDHDTIEQNGPASLTHDYPAAIFNTTGGNMAGEQTGPIKIISSSISNNSENGIANRGGQITISASSITGNDGAGIQNFSALIIDTSVVGQNGVFGIFMNNTAALSASMEMTRTSVNRNGYGGIDVEGGTLQISNSTIGTNSGVGLLNRGWAGLEYDTVAFNTGAGIEAAGGTTAVYDSIVALNGGSNCTPSTHLTIDHASLACNDALTNVTLKLGSLTVEAGTWDLPLLDGSPAINAAGITCPEISNLDQRGYVRPYGPACDIGAYEFGAGSHLTYGTPVPETPTLPMLEIVTNTLTAQLAAQVIPNLNAYCRKGPGTLYDQVTVLETGTAYNVIGRDELVSWWQIQVPGSNDCWVGDANVSKQGPVEQARIVPGLPLPETPASFVNSNVCDIKLKTLGVDLNWVASQGVTGYRIYRNGDLLTTVAASQTSYHDDSPMGVDLVYELEAFNNNGVAVRIPTSVPACK